MLGLDVRHPPCTACPQSHRKCPCTAVAFPDVPGSPQLQIQHFTCPRHKLLRGPKQSCEPAAQHPPVSSQDPSHTPQVEPHCPGKFKFYINLVGKAKVYFSSLHLQRFEDVLPTPPPCGASRIAASSTVTSWLFP